MLLGMIIMYLITGVYVTFALARQEDNRRFVFDAEPLWFLIELVLVILFWPVPVYYI